MDRGRRQLTRHRHIRASHPPGRPAFAKRSFAVNALAATGAAVSALNPAQAVQLGEIAIESSLGQPFSARVPVEIGAGEILGSACISAPPATTPELTTLPRPLVSVPEAAQPGVYELRVTTEEPLYEPMYELQVAVRCPGTALLVRQYVLMLDLPGAAPAVTASGAAAAPPPAVASAAPTPVVQEPPRERRPRAERSHAPAVPIDGGTRYRVAEGDTLSTIAARVANRHGKSLWTVADQIFAANPEAFIGNDPDLIKLGSEIVIPASGEAPAQARAAAVATPPPAPETVPAPEPVASAPVEVSQPAVDPVAESPVTPPADVAGEPPVFADERASAADSGDEVRAETAPVARREEGAPVWLAAILGLLVGAGVSLALLRDRLMEALRAVMSSRARRTAYEPEITARPAKAAPVKRLSAESTMVVVEGSSDEGEPARVPAPVAKPVSAPAPAPAVAAVDDDVADSDLTRLFADAPLASSSDADGDTAENIAADGADFDLDLDLTAATPDVTIDQDIAWIGDDTALAPTAEAPTIDATGSDQIDLQTLTERATSDQQISQTLKEALNLLESDYEDELTASQVIDRTKLAELMEGDQGETLARTGTDEMPGRRR